MRCGWPQCLRGVVRGTISLTRPTVLIVDDHEAFRASARALLQAGGFDVIGEASDGTKAIAAVTALRPAIVLLDVQLPDLDGLAVAERLAQAADPPMVVLDAQGRLLLFNTRDPGHP